MKEFEPKKKIKIFTKEFFIKYSYVFILAIILFLGTSYSLTYFVQKMNIASGSIVTAPLNVSLSNNVINATNLTKPADDQEGLSEYAKQITITNNATTDSTLTLTLTRISGLNFSDMNYALVVNGAIQTIGAMPSDGVILDTAIMGNEVINVELRLWPKPTYTGSETTFVGELVKEIDHFGEKASNRTDLDNTYVEFNCLGSTCETWRIVKVENGRLVLTREADLSGADEREDSGKYNPSLTFNDNSMITSVSTDNKNVYLAKTVKIDGGEGTQASPFTLINEKEREPDKKVVAIISYKADTDTIGTQYIYYNETTYISQIYDELGFRGWTDGTNDYELGDIVAFNNDIDITAKMVPILQSVIKKLCNDSSITYVKKYDAQSHGAAIDTPNGSGDSDVCYYTTTATTRNNDADKNANVIFGDFCWQIVRTTADGGVKLLYNGLKTADNKCTSDADTSNYNSNQRPSTKVFNGTANSSTDLSGTKKYGTGYELCDDNGTTKFKLTGVSLADWSSNPESLIGKYTCMNTNEICTTMYYVGNKQDTNASTVSYTVTTPAHYSIIGKTPLNANNNSPALLGYMYNDVYQSKGTNRTTTISPVLNRVSMSNSTAYYYGDAAVWVTDHYELRVNTGTELEPIYDDPPSSTTTWSNIKATVGGKYTCKSNNATTGKSCATVYYAVASNTGSYLYLLPLSNEETKDKSETWNYGTSITKTGNTYTLMDGENTSTLTATIRLADWYTDYSQYKNIYVCDDYTSTSCTTVYYISDASTYQRTHHTLNYTYYFASDIDYDSNTHTYSYDTDGTILEIYDWPNNYNKISSTHFMCENYDVANNTCGANNPINYIHLTTSTGMFYLILDNLSDIETAITKMLSRDEIINNQIVTVNKYNSAAKGVVDNWYKQNIDDKNLSNYLDDDAVFCNDRNIINIGGWVKTGSTTSNPQLRFSNYNYMTVATNANLTCANITDRFSKTNEKALLTYPVGMLSEQERGLMGQGYARTGQGWWTNSPNDFSNPANNRYADTVGKSASGNSTTSLGIRPAIVLEPAIELEVGGDGTYNAPYVVKVTPHVSNTS